MISKDLIKNLERKNEGISIAILMGEWSLILSSILVATIFPSPWMSILAILIIASRQGALMEILHEASHHNLFHSLKLTRALQFLYAYPLFFTLSLYQRDHLAHHRNSDHPEKDPYFLWVKEADLFENNRSVLWFFFIKPMLGFQAITFFRYMAQACRDRSYTLQVGGFWLVVFLVGALTQTLSMIFLYWLLPYFLIQVPIQFWMVCRDHYKTQKTARSLSGNWFYRNFIGHYNNDLHDVHHLYPQVPWHNLKKARALLPDDQLAPRQSFIEFVHEVADGETSPGWSGQFQNL